MPAPRSDYFCSKCDRTHADLSIGTDTCPGCGKKKFFTRVYSANISASGIAKRKEPQLEAAYDAARAPKEAAKLSARNLTSPMLAVPLGNITGALTDHAKRQLQERGVSESKMALQPMGGVGPIQPGTSHYKSGHIRGGAPLDRGLSKEIKLHKPQPKVAGRTRGSDGRDPQGEAIAKEVGQWSQANKGLRPR